MDTRPLTLFDAICTDRLARRREVAQARAREVLDWLAQQGVAVRLIGSLADGRFGLYSDVDFLVTRLAHPQQRYALEAGVEDRMGGLPFDVIYEDEVDWA